MLEQILDFIHNYFVTEEHKGTFVIENGYVRDIDFLISGQYFKICGSALNDGVYKYPASNLLDEEFSGEIWAMAVPTAVIKISKEISDWMDKYGDVTNSPYSSESFGGYSYTKAQGGRSGGNSVMSWQSMFASRLNAWRKIS